MKNNSISNDTLNVISFLRFPMALLVVFVHATLSNVEMIDSVTMPFPYHLSLLLSDILGCIGVPCFFLISGYLFFLNVDNYNSDIYAHKLKRRAHSLLKPYFAWNTIYLLFVLACQTLLPQLMNGSNKAVADYRWFDWILSYVSMDYVNNGFSFRTFDLGPIDQPLWFVRDLLLLGLISPLIYSCVKKMKFLLVIVFALWITDSLQHLLCIHMVGFLFFSIGAYFSANKLDFVALLRPYGRYVTFAYVLVVVVLMILKPDGLFLKNLGLLFGVPTSVYLADVIMSKTGWKPNRLLSDGSFFLYACHFYVVIAATRILVKMFIESEALMSLAYLSVPIVVSVIVISIYYFLKSYFPSLLSILTGGR